MIKNEFYLILILIITWIIYMYSKITGLIISLLAFGCLFYLKEKNNYMLKTMLKISLVLVTSFIIFLTTNNIINPYIFNKTITNLIRLNIGCLCLSIDNLLVWFGLIITTITTPTFIYKNNIIEKKSNLLDINIWFLLTTIILYQYYRSSDFYVSENYILVLCALFFPFITQIFTNQWLESRALFLSLITIIDLFN